MLGIALDKRGLRAFGCGAPQMGELVIVMTVRPEHDELLVRKERRRAVALALGGLRQGEADLSDLLFDGGGHVGDFNGAPPSRLGEKDEAPKARHMT